MTLGAGPRQRLFALARETRVRRDDLVRQWTRRLSESGTIRDLPPDEALPSFLALHGGFDFPLAEIQNQDEVVRAALNQWGSVHGDTFHSRSYDYFAADRAMHLEARHRTAAERWSAVAARWPRYAPTGESLSDRLGRPPLPFVPWLTLLGFLEWPVNDLCAAYWVLLQAGGPAAADRDLVRTRMAGLAEVIAEICWHVWNAPDECRPGSWTERLCELLSPVGLAGPLERVGRCLAEDPALTLRTVREGDQLWPLLAAFDTQMTQIDRRHPNERIVLASEAFGAIHVGFHWRAMTPLAARSRITVVTTRFSVHESEMGRDGGWRSERIDVDGAVVVHADDNLFTGRTHAALKSALEGVPRAVYLAAMTYDLGTPFNHPEEMLWKTDDVDEHLDATESLAREPSGLLPCAPSFWARRKGFPEPCDEPDLEIRRVQSGSDRLMAALWHRYEEQIRND